MWTLLTDVEKLINALETKYFRKMPIIYYMGHNSNEYVRKMIKFKRLMATVKRRRFACNATH